MPSLSTIEIFCLAAAILIVIPGPAVLYIVGRSLHQGRAAGIVSCLGVGTGGLVHATAAAVGVSALLASSALAFSVVKYVGAAYLIVLGIRKILERRGHSDRPAPPPDRLRRIYTQGVIVSVFNPKPALFFLAFLPQFIDPARGNGGLQALILGLCWVVIALVSDTTYAVVASAAGHWLARRRRFAARSNVVAGGIYIALGATTALTGAARQA